jgi:DNA polymerase (family 10)
VIDRHGVALVLEQIGTMLELKGGNPYRSRAFHSAARAIDTAPAEPAALIETGGLLALKGVGPATAKVVTELVETGRSSLYDELRSQTPSGLRDLLAVPGLGAKKIKALHEQLGIDSVADLERAAAEGRVAVIPGFGERMQEKIAAGVTFVRGATGRRRLSQVAESAFRIVRVLQTLPAVRRVEVAGELRRCMETVDGIDVIACADTADVASVLAGFVEIPGVAAGNIDGTDKAVGRLSDGLEVRLLCVPPGSFAAAWVGLTGSDGHVSGLRTRADAAGLALDERAITRAGRTVDLDDEADLYEALGLPWIAPELREGAGEVEAAAAGELPDLVDIEDLRGCFHCHTTYSDGRATLVEIAEAAIERGWRYLGIADHSRNAAYAGGLTADRIAQQHEEIDAWNDANGSRLWLFKGIEADILADGAVDFEGEGVLERFDYVVASVHSSFALPRREMTKRIQRAISNPNVTFLGHATGRRLLQREGYDVDVHAVLETAAERGVAVEINADPNRLDLDWRHWRQALSLGVRTAINPDAHSTRALDNVHYGVKVARKGWVRASDVVNAWNLDEVRAYFARADGAGRAKPW